MSDSRAVVAMVGLDPVQRGEFETIDGMPVYYGGDLCDSDGSEWDDPWDLAYAEYVDQYNNPVLTADIRFEGQPLTALVPATQDEIREIIKSLHQSHAS